MGNEELQLMLIGGYAISTAIEQMFKDGATVEEIRYELNLYNRQVEKEVPDEVRNLVSAGVADIFIAKEAK